MLQINVFVLIDPLQWSNDGCLDQSLLIIRLRFFLEEVLKKHFGCFKPLRITCIVKIVQIANIKQIQSQICCVWCMIYIVLVEDYITNFPNIFIKKKTLFWYRTNTTKIWNKNFLFRVIFINFWLKVNSLYLSMFKSPLVLFWQVIS